MKKDIEIILNGTEEHIHNNKSLHLVDYLDLD